MRFRRPAVHYGLTPAPVTPFQKAAQVWDERLGSARVQAHNWRLMAFGCLLLAALSAGDDIWWRAHRSVVVPYVVQMSRGEVEGVHEGRTPYTPTDPEIAQQLARFIENVRGSSIDQVIVHRDWLNAYDFVTDRGAAFLNDYARLHDPFADIGKRSVIVNVVSVVRASDKSFQVQWDEQTYLNGTAAGTEQWTAILTVVIQPPDNAKKLLINPLGIYVDGISWSRQFTTPAPQANPNAGPSPNPGSTAAPTSGGTSK